MYFGNVTVQKCLDVTVIPKVKYIHCTTFEGGWLAVKFRYTGRWNQVGWQIMWRRLRPISSQHHQRQHLRYRNTCISPFLQIIRNMRVLLKSDGISQILTVDVRGLSRWSLVALGTQPLVLMGQSLIILCAPVNGMQKQLNVQSIHASMPTISFHKHCLDFDNSLMVGRQATRVLKHVVMMVVFRPLQKLRRHTASP